MCCLLDKLFFLVLLVHLDSSIMQAFGVVISEVLSSNSDYTTRTCTFIHSPYAQLLFNAHGLQVNAI